MLIGYRAARRARLQLELALLLEPTQSAREDARRKLEAVSRGARKAAVEHGVPAQDKVVGCQAVARGSFQFGRTKWQV